MVVTVETSIRVKLKELHFNQLVNYSEHTVEKQQEKFLDKNKKNLNRLIELKFGNFTQQNLKTSIGL